MSQSVRPRNSGASAGPRRGARTPVGGRHVGQQIFRYSRCIAIRADQSTGMTSQAPVTEETKERSA
jgi:hypothetical protein